MTTLKQIFTDEGIKPVRDAQAQWLRQHRPSVAMLLCLGSGPWKIGRRFTVQANALKVLGERDIIELKPHEVQSIFPLDWQRKYLKAARRFVTTRQVWDFDSIFNIRKTPDVLYEAILSIHYLAHGYHIGVRSGACKKPLPKVLGMFVRDFIMLDCFPQDRHVRKWLKDHNLPTHQAKIMAMFKAEKLHARYYARALFLDKSKNPVHKPTRRF